MTSSEFVNVSMQQGRNLFTVSSQSIYVCTYLNDHGIVFSLTAANPFDQKSGVEQL